MIKEITAKYNAEQIEKKITQLWKDSDAYRKTREHRKTGKRLFFVDGPRIRPDISTWELPGIRSLKIPFFAITP